MKYFRWSVKFNICITKYRAYILCKSKHTKTLKKYMCGMCLIKILCLIKNISAFLCENYLPRAPPKKLA